MRLRLLSFFPLLAIVSCATTESNRCDHLSAADEILGQSLVRVVDHDSALSQFLDSAPSNGGGPDADLVQYFEAEWPPLEAASRKGAKIFWFKESKGSLGWRQGLVAVHNCHGGRGGSRRETGEFRSPLIVRFHGLHFVADVQFNRMAVALHASRGQPTHR